MTRKAKWIIFFGVLIAAGIIFLSSTSVFSSSKQDDNLLGVDSDHNGIRDDIDEYIKKRFPKSQRKQAALSQMARDYQNAFSVYDDSEKLKNAVNSIERTFWCLESVFRPDSVDESHALMAELFNNSKRSAPRKILKCNFMEMIEEL